jgi:hypothetical protein
MARGDPPLHLDYGPPKGQVAEYMRNESRAADARALTHPHRARRSRRVPGTRLESLSEMRGNMNLLKVPDADAYERANYMLMLQGWRV